MNPKTHRFGLFRVRSPLLTKSLNCFLFLQVLRWFTSLSSLPKAYVFSNRILHFQRSGFPHSDIFGSTPVCGFPKLFAAYHVLHRLPSPRHPPYALSSLIITCLWRSLCYLQSLPINIQLSKNLKVPNRTASSIRLQRRCMEMIGIEPTASAVQVRRSPS